MQSSNDPYLKLLMMARDDLLNGVGIDLRKFTERCKEVGLANFAIDLYRDIYNPEYPQTQGLRTNNQISLESYLKLLQYDELKHSLAESKQARKEAKIAIWLAGLAVVVQIIIWAIDCI